MQESPNNGHRSGKWDLPLTVLGLFLTVGGLLISVSQVQQAMEEAEENKKQAQKLAAQTEALQGQVANLQGASIFVASSRLQNIGKELADQVYPDKCLAAENKNELARVIRRVAERTAITEETLAFCNSIDANQIIYKKDGRFLSAVAGNCLILTAQDIVESETLSKFEDKIRSGHQRKRSCSDKIARVPQENFYVALGFDEPRSNFTVVRSGAGDQHDNGKTVVLPDYSTNVTAGAVLKARWSVNLRKSNKKTTTTTSDGDSINPTIRVLSAGDCVKLAEDPMKLRSQFWVSVEVLKSCDI